MIGKINKLMKRIQQGKSSNYATKRGQQQVCRGNDLIVFQIYVFQLTSLTVHRPQSYNGQRVFLPAA